MQEANCIVSHALILFTAPKAHTSKPGWILVNLSDHKEGTSLSGFPDEGSTLKDLVIFPFNNLLPVGQSLHSRIAVVELEQCTRRICQKVLLVWKARFKTSVGLAESGERKFSYALCTILCSLSDMRPRVL